MASGDILSVLADKGTLDLTKADTTAIRNTLGEFPGGGGIESTVVEMLQELLTQPKVIKNIQRGTGQVNSSQAFTVNVANFDPDKSIVIINNGADNSIKLNGTTNNSITLQSHTSQYTYYSYQILEYC